MVVWLSWRSILVIYKGSCSPINYSRLTEFTIRIADNSETRNGFLVNPLFPWDELGKQVEQNCITLTVLNFETFSG